MSDEIAGVVLFAAVPAIVWAISHYRHKSQKDAAQVLTAMVDKGEPLSPEIIRALGVRGRRPHADLRTGAILIAVALATFIFAGIVPEQEGKDAVAALAMFPLLVGAVFVGLWAFIGRKELT